MDVPYLGLIYLVILVIALIDIIKTDDAAVRAAQVRLGNPGGDAAVGRCVGVAGGRAPGR